MPEHSEHTQAIPRSLNLGLHKPTSVPAYTRRVTSIATNAQTFSENDLANIVLDTSTPGSFLDPTQSLIQFDLQITNTNPYIDYVNFSTCGAGSLIQEFRIICQGTPIEEILDYNTMFEMWMDIGGFCQEEFKMYMENPWKAPAIHPSTEVNFVKPPMLDREGVIMCPNDVNMFGVPSKFHNYRTQGRSFTFATQCGVAALNSSLQATQATLGLNRGGICGPANAGAFAMTGTLADTNRNYQHTWAPVNTNTEFWTGSAAPGNIRASTWTNAIDNTYVTWPATIRPVSRAVMRTQLALNDQGIKKYRLQDYLLFLTNVKNIPIGVAPTQSILKNNSALVGEQRTSTTAVISYDTLIDNWNFAVGTLLTNLSSKQTYTISLPIFSGLIGVWAEKAFPTMLIAPGSFYLQIRFAKVSQAFQFTMDPCRRIFGTYRDYVPSIGLPSGYCTEYGGNCIANSRVNYLNNLTVAGGTTWLAITDHGANGTDFAYKGYNIIPSVSDTALTAPSVLITAGGVETGATNNWLQFNDYNCAKLYNTANAGAANKDTMTSWHQKDGTATGNPKPQYVPVCTPWIYGQRFTNALVPGTSSAYCEESNCCFGTYLSSSTAQVRRTTTKSNSLLGLGQGGANVAIDTALGTTSSPKVTILIQNLMYVGQQIILPDEVTASVVRMAVNGDISIVSHSCKTYRATMNSATTQNLILPIKIASANALFVLFQNTQMIENCMYASCTRNCPFTALEWQDTGYVALNTNTTTLPYFVGSDKAPTLTGLSTQNPFSIQLRLGNELLPIQPITNLHMLTQELQRAVHAANDMMWSVPTLSTVRNYRATTPTTAVNTLTNPEYLSIKNNDFLTPFVPIEALDDQTITDNILYRDYGLAANSRGQFVINEFIPPISKFMLGFDLETFPNQSDMARSGRYLGNGPVTLVMTNTIAPSVKSVSSQAAIDTYNAIAVVLFDIRFSIMSGGQVLSYY